MHEGEFAVTGDLVTRLIAAQFPRWAGWPVKPVASSGTVNATAGCPARSRSRAR
jgi:aminoglycoside phosphotransferase (APT) family kinase protein